MCNASCNVGCDTVRSGEAEMTVRVFGDSHLNVIKTVPLSDPTASRKIGYEL